MEYQTEPLMSNDDFNIPATHEVQEGMYSTDEFYFNPHRVDQKLEHNRLRKMQIEYQKYVEKMELLQKRKKRQKQIYQYTLKRQNWAKQQRQANLRSNSLQLKQKEKEESQKHKEKVSKLKASETMINLCRKRVEDKRNQYIFRIQSKTKEKQERAHVRKQIMETLADQLSNQVHFEEWKQTEAKLIKKYHGKHIQPDRLYQEYKQRNLLTKVLLKAQNSNSSENIEKSNKEEVKITQNQEKSKLVDFTRNGEIQAITNSTKQNHSRSQGTINTGKTIPKKANKKVEYFGVHQEDMLKQTNKDMIKMRRFIEDHTIMTDPTQDPELCDKFQQFLLRQILHY